MRSLPVIFLRWQYIRHVRLVFSQGGRPLTIYKPTRQTFVNIFRPRPAPRGLSLIALPLVPSEQSAFRARPWIFNLTLGYYWIRQLDSSSRYTPDRGTISNRKPSCHPSRWPFVSIARIAFPCLLHRPPGQRLRIAVDILVMILLPNPCTIPVSFLGRLAIATGSPSRKTPGNSNPRQR
jgi:hypothetical protein